MQMYFGVRQLEIARLNTSIFYTNLTKKKYFPPKIGMKLRLRDGIGLGITSLTTPIPTHTSLSNKQ